MRDDFFIVDVFAEHPYSGNPLAVILDDGSRDSATMQKIAAEMNFSETVFVSPKADASGSYNMRIFTPVRELDFAGHPILGTASVLRDYVVQDGAEKIILGLRVGAVPVRFETRDSREVAWFEAPRMSLGARAPIQEFAHALNLRPEDINSESPCQIIAAGTSAVMVPIVSNHALFRASLDLAKYQPLTARGFPPLLYLFTRETLDPDNDLCVRFFFEANGVREDPATGNGAAFLGYYLLQHNVFRSHNIFLRIEQGHQLGRPSLILLNAHIRDSTPHVHIGGQVKPVAAGRLI